LLVFVAAERRELEGLLVHADDVTTPDWPVDFVRLGRVNGRQVVMVANGPGRKLAGFAVDTVKAHQSMDGLVSVGFCGGLQPWLATCDIFVASEIVGVAPALQPTSQKIFKTGKLLSIDRVVTTAGQKAEVGKAGAAAVEMEAYAVAERAQESNVPFYAIRVITDTWNESFCLDFNRMRSNDGRFSRAKILAAALRSPAKTFPELIKLNKTTKRAAQALGDFIADARF
jgi:adenosylhomocysteine nucleosidase